VADLFLSHLVLDMGGSCYAGMLLMFSLLLLLIQLSQPYRMPLTMSDPLSMMSKHFLGSAHVSSRCKIFFTRTQVLLGFIPRQPSHVPETDKLCLSFWQ
jgi:hypothetical protein